MKENKTVPTSDRLGVILILRVRRNSGHFE